MDGDGRILYVPLENRVRELDARLLLSLVAASANLQVVMGPKALLARNMPHLPHGIYAVKTLNKIDAEDMRFAIKYGHSPIAWDEEGPGQIVPEVYLKSIDDVAVQRTGRIYAWGEHQAAALSRKYPDAKGKIRALGNPRWDLLRPEFRAFFSPEADAIRAKFGRIILINTNFSSCNSMLTESQITSVADETGAFDRNDDADQRMLRNIIEFERQNFDDYMSLLPGLSAAFPQHTIIVRPHPTENHQRWKDFVVPFPNIQAVYEGTVIPWLLAADAVIQNSCTTGVEALTLGRVVVSYCKSSSPFHDLHLANAVCPRIHDETTLIDQLRRFISDPTTFSERYAVGRRTLAMHISRLDGETSSAAIVKSAIFYANKLEKQGAHFDRTFRMAQEFKPPHTNVYTRLKLPPISFDDLLAKASRFAKLRPNFAPAIKIAELYESCFYFGR